MIIKIFSSTLIAFVVGFNLSLLYNELNLGKIKNIFLKYFFYFAIIINVFYIYYFNINYFDILFSTIFTIIIITVLIVLGSAGVWSYSYTKYIGVICIFFIYSGLQNAYLGNLFFFTIALMLYLTILYYIKTIFVKEVRNHFLTHIKDTFKAKIQNKGNIYIKTINLGVEFITVFIILRLVRASFMGHFGNYIYGPENIIRFGIFLLLMLFLTRYAYIYYNKYIVKNNKLLYSLFISLIIYFIYVQISDPEGYIVLRHMIVYGLFIYTIFRFGKNIFKTTQSMIDTEIVKCNDLKKGQIIDKDFLLKVLVYYKPKEKELREFIKSINNPLSNSDIKKIKSFFKKSERNAYRQKLNNFSPCYDIRIQKTFKIGPLIFISFLFTYFTELNIIKFVIFEYIIK